MNNQKELEQELKKSIFKRIEQILKEIGTKPAEFQKKLKIESQNWNNWKNRGIPLIEAIKLAEALNLNLDWVFAEKGEKFKEPQFGFSSLMAPSTPGTYAMLEILEKACQKGRLTEDDLDLLNAIARRLTNGTGRKDS